MNVNNENRVSMKVESKSLICVDNGLVHIEMDLEKGEYSCAWQGLLILKEVRSAFRWNGREYHTGAYERHVMNEQPEEIEDGFGKGVHVVILHESSSLPNLEQHFYMYEDASYFLTKVVVIHEEETKLNRIAVMKTNVLSFDNGTAPEDELQVLRVPYDNDKWVRYVAQPLPLETESYEVTALYQPGKRHGFILGSITHDVWKTGIRIKGEQAGKLDEIELYGGATGVMTRDSQPHGYVLGSRIESPLVFAGFYEDYREGLETYGWANTRIAASLNWDGGAPFGWNSWSAAMSELDYDLYISTSDFLKQEVQSLGFQNEDTLYINFDAFWDKLTAEEMEDALNRVRQNGHKPGTYWTPFAFWGSPAQFSQTVEGTNGKYTYSDIILQGC